MNVTREGGKGERQKTGRKWKNNELFRGFPQYVDSKIELILIELKPFFYKNLIEYKAKVVVTIFYREEIIELMYISRVFMDQPLKTMKYNI